MRKTPRGWIQIGESRTRGVARIPLGLKPSRDSRATSQRDSPIWIQPLGVFSYRVYFKCTLKTEQYCLLESTVRFITLTHWGRDQMDAIFQTTFQMDFHEWNYINFDKIKSLKLISKCPITNLLTMIQIMAWYRPGDKQSSDPLMASLLTHKCVIRPQWVNNTSEQNFLFEGIFCTRKWIRAWA